MKYLKPLIHSLQNFAQKRLGFESPPKLFLKQDQENAQNILGKTAFYDPGEKSVTIFVTGRHPKDILRSFAHELVHHTQNLRGDLTPEKCGEMGVGYAQKNKYMREMERQAFEEGSLCFRDWEDGIKVAIQRENKILKENQNMSKSKKDVLAGLIRKILKERLSEQNRMTSRERAAMIAKKNRELGIGGSEYDQEMMSQIFMNAPEDEKDRLRPAGDHQGYAGSQDQIDTHYVGGPKKTGMDLAKASTTFYGKTGAQADKEIEADRAAMAKGRDLMKDRRPPAVIRKGAKQDKLLRRVGLRNMKKLQALVGAKQTGEYNTQTMNLIMKLQRNAGVTPDGIYGPKTARARKEMLQGGSSTASISGLTGREMAKRTFKESDELDEAGCGKSKAYKRDYLEETDEISEALTPDAIMAAQEKLGVEKDGKLGPVTKAAILRFQKAKGLRPDGMLGPKTLQALMKNPAPMSETDESALHEGEPCPNGCNCNQNQKGLEEGHPLDVAKPHTGKPDAKDFETLRARAKDKKDESKIQTPEQEKRLYESRFNKRNEEIFDKLKKLWTK